MSIHRLSPELAKKIAAGEIIERPLSVVKELIENSIDAGAAQINVELIQGGKVLISVADDGSGIAPDELPLALEKHATSKISSDEDLEAILTLGYRGEALASISAVSDLELYSRRHDLPSGALLLSKEGEVSVSESTLPPGTRVTVKDLFYNLPARRKFMKSAQAECRRILHLMQDYGLAYPAIAFRLINDGKKLFQSYGSGDVTSLLRQLWGEEPEIRQAEQNNGSSQVKIWWQDCGASSRFQLTVFMNGRRISDGTIRSAVLFHPWANRGNWFLFLTMPPEDVDINVHPTKSEVLLRRSGEVFDLVRKGVEQLSKGFSPMNLSKIGKPSLPPEGGTKESSLSFRTTAWSQQYKVPKERDPFSRVTAPQFRVSSGRASVLMDSPDELPSSQAFQSRERAPLVEGEEISSAFLTEPLSYQGQESGGIFSFLGQLTSGYLIFEDSEGLLIVDPHAAHERIFFEKIRSACSGLDGLEPLVVPIPLPPSLREEALFYREDLEELGMKIDADGNLKCLPVHAKGLNMAPLDLLRGALGALEDKGDSRPFRDRWALRACKSSVKLTTSLEPVEAIELLEELRRCEQPNACPHGRPTILRLDKNALGRHFGRQK